MYMRLEHDSFNSLTRARQDDQQQQQQQQQQSVTNLCRFAKMRINTLHY